MDKKPTATIPPAGVAVLVLGAVMMVAGIVLTIRAGSGATLSQPGALMSATAPATKAPDAQSATRPAPTSVTQTAATPTGAPQTATPTGNARPLTPAIAAATSAPVVVTGTSTGTTATVPPFEARPAPNAPAGAPNPLFGPNYNPDDGLPTFICSTDAFASYLTLLQLQVGGFDMKHGFHLGLVPYELNEKEYSISQDEAEAYIKNGDWDCTLNTVDGIARTAHAVITGIVDESAGGDGLWARDTPTIYDLKGKRIAYSVGSSGDFYLRYVLQVAQLDPSKDVTLVPADTVDEAVALFNQGNADAVSAWEPQLSQAADTGGKPLVTTDQLRIIIDAILVSRKSIETKPDVVQAFHDAWFDTMKAQTEDFDTAAAQIAAWGNNDWTAVMQESSADDFRDQLKLIAQADLNDNVTVMSSLTPVINQLEVSRRVWSSVQQVPDDPLDTLVDPRFVLKTATKSELQSLSKPVNDTFSLAAAKQDSTQAAPTAASTPGASATSAPISPTVSSAPAITRTTAGDQATLAVLPCRKFTFLANSTQLTQESRQVLDLCVVPTLQQRAGLRLQVKGSAAWPAPLGDYSEQQIRAFAASRAQSIADYLIQQNIDPERLVIEGVLPPETHRGTADPATQAEDRYVEMTLITGGL